MVGVEVFGRKEKYQDTILAFSIAKNYFEAFRKHFLVYLFDDKEWVGYSFIGNYKVFPDEFDGEMLPAFLCRCDFN